MDRSPDKRINKFSYVQQFPKINDNFYGGDQSRPESPKDTIGGTRAPMTSERSITSDLRTTSFLTDHFRSRRVIHNTANVTQRISINGSIEDNDIYRIDNSRTKSPSPIHSRPRRMRIMSKEDRPSNNALFRQENEVSDRYYTNDSFT